MKIVYYPDPVLSQETQPIEQIDDELVAIGQNMIKAMHEAHGVGLAGPQVGLARQIIVVNPSAEEGEEQIYLNPKILKRKGRELGEEGCLSFPGLYGSVYRAQWIRVSAMLLSGEQVVFEAEDFAARVLQHEIDHLRGVLFVNKVQAAEKVAVRRRLREMESKYSAAVS